MKQSNNKKSRDVTAFLYERLSRDDNLEGESYSIGNQKKLLAKVAKEKGYTNLVHFLDDGISGVTMDRPGFVEMIRQLEQGKAAAVFVKDLSRLGRNYIEVGRLTEEFFPDHDIRLVAVSDNIDTAEGENELAPIRNLFNEWYARDISKKRRISNKIKGNAGEPMGQPPYGYIKDPNDPKHWIVDDEAAQVVRRVYSMTLEGFGTEQIAAQLEKDDVLTPRAYWLTKGIKRPGKGKQQPPTKWNSSTITKILSLQEYCGDILNFKTYSKSYKNKKRIDNDRENWVVFQDVHEAIIERAVYEQVQQKRGKIRKRRTNNGEHNMFSGLLVCADCGSNLHFHFNQGMTNVLTAFSCQRAFVIFYLLNSDITGGVVHNYAFSCIHRYIGCRQRKCAWNLDGTHTVIVNTEPLLPYTVDLFCIEHFDFFHQFIQHPGCQLFCSGVLANQTDEHIRCHSTAALLFDFGAELFDFSVSSFCSSSYLRDILEKRSSEILPETLSS